MFQKITKKIVFFSLTSHDLQNKSISGVFGTKTGIGKRGISTGKKKKLKKLSSRVRILDAELNLGGLFL
jgi:hypothetical protein